MASVSWLPSAGWTCILPSCAASTSLVWATLMPQRCVLWMGRFGLLLAASATRHIAETARVDGRDQGPQDPG